MQLCWAKVAREEALEGIVQISVVQVGCQLKCPK